jgi:xanthine dehydrogenase accessory factor
MRVFERTEQGTIGGGHLELDAIAQARRMLRQASCEPPIQSVQSERVAAAHSSGETQIKRYPLGPSLGQCCGGVVHLRLTLLPAGDDLTILALEQAEQAGHAPLALFGGGHVGTALVRVLADLPFAVTWVDSRDEVFPTAVPANVRCEHSNPVQAAVNHLPSNSAILIMSFSHAEDLDIVAACLQRVRERGDLPFIGLIGSKTKWASFKHRLVERGFAAAELSRITCPIGVAGIAGKEPAVIAVSVAAQLLQTAQQLTSLHSSSQA